MYSKGWLIDTFGWKSLRKHSKGLLPINFPGRAARNPTLARTRVMHIIWILNFFRDCANKTLARRRNTPLKARV